MLPKLFKQWVISPNNVLTGSTTGELTKVSLLFIKRMLKTLVTGSAWTVVGSSNSLTASMNDGVDRWNSLSDLVGNSNGNPHSWMILQQTAVAPQFQLLLNFCYYTTSIQVYFSPAGLFASGTTTTTPSAVDGVSVTLDWSGERPWNIDGLISGLSNNKSDLIPVILHAFGSADGTCMRFVCCYDGAYRGILGIEKPINVVDEWTSASIGYADWAGAQYWDAYRSLAYSGGGTWRGYVSGTVAYFDPLIECTSQGGPGNFIARGLLTTSDQMTNLEWVFWPIGLNCFTNGLLGHHGDLADLWVTHWYQGDTALFPSDGSRQFVKFGPYILPWDGVSKLRTKW